MNIVFFAYSFITILYIQHSSLYATCPKDRTISRKNSNAAKTILPCFYHFFTAFISSTHTTTTPVNDQHLLLLPSVDFAGPLERKSLIYQCYNTTNKSGLSKNSQPFIVRQTSTSCMCILQVCNEMHRSWPSVR